MPQTLSFLPPFSISGSLLSLAIQGTAQDLIIDTDIIPYEPLLITLLTITTPASIDLAPVDPTPANPMLDGPIPIKLEASEVLFY